ncbi:monocarboxylate permease [Pochonia chlamydosporia 170]|uniref:Monocarboxylate permease n=1 Tax=Pochonia chlamydosporia 170 TaxID=1380566 RepID=A0A179FB96_METCM|nr:monocarboxylate permease [Pochonia chlamydosporia 170]OAQ62379.1 monocarboxylate permease [Pochonia chlamydosporia 170]
MSTTAIQLTTLPSHPISRPAASQPVPQDDILLASREADAHVPDGGYGWAIVLSGSIILFWAVGATYAWGVMQAALVEDGLSGPAVLSFVGSLSASLVSVFAIVNARLMRKLGPRSTAVCGMSLLGGSMILSGFAVGSVGGLFCTVGVLMGFGASLCFIVVLTIPSQYFRSKRGIANGLIVAGGGWGAAAISFSLDALIRKLGPAWAYRVLGLTTLATGVPAAWLMKERMPLSTPGLIEWRLFKSLTFNLVFLSGAIGTFPLYVTPFFIPLYTKTLGFTSSTGAGLVAGFSISSAVGRILTGLACDKLGALNTLFISNLVTALSMLAIWPASTSLGPLAVFVVLNGLSNGGFFSTMPTVVSNVFGSARVSVAMSMVITGWLGGYLMGSPIAGYLLEAYGGAGAGLKAYRPAMFYAGSLALASAVMVLVARVRQTGRLFAIL